MKRECLIGIFCLIIAGFAGADYLATSISTDGSVMLTTSGSDVNGSFTSRALAVDGVNVVRSALGGESLDSDLSIQSSGPVLVSDYGSVLQMPSDIMDLCKFLDAGSDRSLGEASIFTSGILQGGGYDASRTIDSGFSGSTRVNGSGLLAFGSQGSSNQSLKSRGFVSGNLSVQDLFRYGGRV
ncbi:MAG TPA: hypothetical protein VN429_11075 [Methanospirillum sp.]|uniref:hypothetical protein n=1 Tax=Methanospirillum sp. TaxID=45200 RepID=UPI002BAD24EA|nr:hypothetical protein [Methanospirillum sp.]HWQ64949.1 hypothetical protein [Methanospirillum sp.]